jgi:hypothetical protein
MSDTEVILLAVGVAVVTALIASAGCLASHRTRNQQMDELIAILTEYLRRTGGSPRLSDG